MSLTRKKILFLWVVSAVVSTLVGMEKRKSTFAQDDSTAKCRKVLPDELETYVEQRPRNQPVDIGENDLRTMLPHKRIFNMRWNIIPLVNPDNNL